MTSERGRPDLEAPDLQAPDVGSPRGPQETAAPEGDDAAAVSTGTVDDTSATSAEEEALDDDLAAARQALIELTADLQRLQAEYVNYKRRVERDRDLVRQNATLTVLGELLPVLDDIDRAREHGELEGGFRAVAESLERIVAQLGLTKYGAKGDEFDPNLHEALMHGHSPEVTTTVVDVVTHAGYRIGDRVVRAAKVTVLDPEQ